MKTNIERLNELATKKSTWLQDAEEREKNKGWLKHSQKVAIKVLSSIRKLGITQKQLAEKMGMSPQMINKIVKGKENLTFQTVAKLEEALDVSLIFTENNRVIFAKEYVVEPKYVYFNTTVRVDLGTHNVPYNQEEQYPELAINEAEVSYGS